MVQAPKRRGQDERHFWLTDEQIERLRPFFPKSRGRPRVDDRRVLSEIIYVKKNGLQWKDAPSVHGPSNMLYNRFVRWSRTGAFAHIFVELARPGPDRDTIMSVMNELKNRGVQDILIAVVDGLKGFPEAISAAFPETTVQICIVHLIRHSMNFCSWKDRKAVAADLRSIYQAPTAAEAARQLDAFEEKWAGKYPSIGPAWRRAWQEVIPFFAFEPAIRKIKYTTNAVEALIGLSRTVVDARKRRCDGCLPSIQNIAFSERVVKFVRPAVS